MELNRTNLDELFRNWKIRANKAFIEGPAAIHDKVCQMEDSSAAVEVYDLLINFPKFKRFKDRIKEQNTASAQVRIANAEWADVVSVPQADVERDTFGKFTKNFEMLGMAARRSPDNSFAELLAASFTTKDYTGTNFFAADKPHLPGVIDGGTFTNLLTVKPSAGSWEAAKVMMGNIKDMNGDPMGIGQTKTVICSTKWASTFRQILGADLVMQVSGDAGAAVSNIYKGDAELIEFHYLNTAARQDNWFVVDNFWPIRAFICQRETALRLYKQDDPNTHKDAFDRHVFLYQGYMRYEMGLGLPQLAVGSTGANAAL